MLKGNNIKLSSKRKPYFQYRRTIRAPFFHRNPALRKAYVAVVFFALTTMFTGVFSMVSVGEQMPRPSRELAVVSSKNKVGVTSPIGEKEVKGAKIATTRTSTSTVQPEANSTVVPPKPNWVNSPLYVDPTNSAAQYIAANPTVSGAAYITRMSKVPVAEWFGDWNTNVKSDVNRYVSAAAATGSIPVIVVYNIPNRDCGGYSVGGANSIAAYTQWVAQVAAGIGSRPAVVVLEPDALGALDCLPANVQQDRIESISQAVNILKASTQTAVYIDAGTPVWQPAKTMASRLISANVAAADGFSLNVSYFATTTDNQQYGNTLAKMVGNKHYVIDTSRNGGNNKPTGMQCNPSFASLGQLPTTDTGNDLNDGLLWIKIPWESDGACNGSPGPGVGYWSYAVQLAINAGW